MPRNLDENCPAWLGSVMVLCEEVVPPSRGSQIQSYIYSIATLISQKGHIPSTQVAELEAQKVLAISSGSTGSNSTLCLVTHIPHQPHRFCIKAGVQNRVNMSNLVHQMCSIFLTGTLIFPFCQQCSRCLLPHLSSLNVYHREHWEPWVQSNLKSLPLWYSTKV